MGKLRDLKDRICSFENLLAAYRDAAKSKRYRNEVISFSFNLEENLLELQRSLLERTYRVGAYREFYIHYPKPRLVMALGFADRIVQHAIYRQINPYIDKRFIRHSYGCRKDKGSFAAALCLLDWVQLHSRKPDAEDYVIIKGDISKYFYRVNHEKILEIYRELIDDEWLLWLLGEIINNQDIPFGLPAGVDIEECPRDKRLYDVGMPIGNLTSQETANIYLDKLDKFCKHTLKIRYYVRSMDDFCIIVRKEQAQELMDKITVFLKEELKLDVSPKSRIIPLIQGCEFVGYSATPHGLRIRKKTLRHMKNSLLHIADMYAVGTIELEKAMETVTSYRGMLKHTNGHNMLRWIEEHFVLKRKENTEMKSTRARDRPSVKIRKQFYKIDPQENGTVDVYLIPDATEYSTGMGVKEFDVSLLVVRGVVPWDGLEEDIRARYDAWCDSAEAIDI